MDGRRALSPPPLDPAEPVLLTRAANERLEGVEMRPLVPLSTFISPARARALTELLVRLTWRRGGYSGQP